jgi:hypothetical protein
MRDERDIHTQYGTTPPICSVVISHPHPPQMLIESFTASHEEDDDCCFCWFLLRSFVFGIGRYRKPLTPVQQLVGNAIEDIVAAYFGE